MTRQDVGQLTLEVGAGQHAVHEVRPVERADQLRVVAQPQLRGDVTSDPCRGGGGERVQADVGEQRPQATELAVFRTEVVAPLADAVRLVDRHEVHAAASQHREEAVAALPCQPLRRHVQQAEPPLAQPGDDGRLTVGGERAVVAGGSDTVADERVHLILHQRDQWGDHDRQSLTEERRRLETERLSGAGRHHDQRVAARHDRVHGFALERPERGVPPVPLQHLAELGRRVHRPGSRLRPAVGAGGNGVVLLPALGDVRESLELLEIQRAQEPLGEEALNPAAQAVRHVEIGGDRHQRTGTVYRRIDGEARDVAGLRVGLDHDASRIGLGHDASSRAHLAEHAHGEADLGARAEPALVDGEPQERFRRHDPPVAVAVVGDHAVDRGGRRVDLSAGGDATGHLEIVRCGRSGCSRSTPPRPWPAPTPVPTVHANPRASIRARVPRRRFGHTGSHRRTRTTLAPAGSPASAAIHSSPPNRRPSIRSEFRTSSRSDSRGRR